MISTSIIKEMGIKYFWKGLFWVKENSPELLMVAGTVLSVTAVAVATKESESAKDDIDQHKENKKIISNCKENHLNKPVTMASGKMITYTENVYKKDVIVENINFAKNIIKDYHKTIILETLSLVCFHSSHIILSRRCKELSAACVAISSAFSKYRENVVNTYGKDVDEKLYHDTKTIDVIEKDAKGKEKKFKKEVSDLDCSPYARFFDQSSRNWTKDSEYNLKFLKDIEDVLQRKLDTQGYLFLNDAYDALDIPCSQAGQIVGWLSKDNGGKDSKVNFGIFNTNRVGEANKRFVNGYESVILLDFNVDGPIYNKFTERGF